MFIPLMDKDLHGRRVIITRPGLEDPRETKVDDLMKACMLIMDVFLEDDEDVTITGVTFVEDVKELSMAHVVTFTPVMVKKMMTLIQVQTNNKGDAYADTNYSKISHLECNGNR
ncbi:hypothetical protein Pcinc_028580 [Petrolisthes cinctipes]|uniref:CRAL-TRIO domain-containing protein n=1 Tax=Petrolisthes cinctipes TaxID=88211 RepID=A0AAE1K569_PETCI|nr:hypothetical protein Pcinc_028580 [Petrolisthes cinctipes]